MMVEVIESKNLQSGQNGSYEDSIYKWRIKVAPKANGHYPNKEEVYDWCNSNLRRCKQTHDEWLKGKPFSAKVYFDGYYELHQIYADTWEYTVVEPYTD